MPSPTTGGLVPTGHTIKRHKVTHTAIDVRSIKSDGYQREVSTTYVKALIKDFDERLLDPVLVANVPGYPDPQNLDGGHRCSMWVALADAGLLDYDIPVRMVDVADASEAANLFIKVNQQRRKLVPYDYWRAALIRGDKYALDIAKVSKDYKLPIERKRRAAHAGSEMACVSNLKRMWKLSDDDTLIRITLDIVTAAWPLTEPRFGRDQYRTHGFMLEGIAQTVLELMTGKSYRWSIKRAIKNLSKFDPKEVHLRVRERAAGDEKSTNNPEVYQRVIKDVFTTGKL